jgi:hypothetical protein
MLSRAVLKCFETSRLSGSYTKFSPIPPSCIGTKWGGRLRRCRKFAWKWWLHCPGSGISVQSIGSGLRHEAEILKLGSPSRTASGHEKSHEAQPWEPNGSDRTTDVKMRECTSSLSGLGTTPEIFVRYRFLLPYRFPSTLSTTPMSPPGYCYGLTILVGYPRIIIPIH